MEFKIGTYYYNMVMKASIRYCGEHGPHIYFRDDANSQTLYYRVDNARDIYTVSKLVELPVLEEAPGGKDDNVDSTNEWAEFIKGSFGLDPYCDLELSCDHDRATYDSGWSRYDYCKKCDYKFTEDDK